MTIDRAIKLQELLSQSNILDPLPMYREAVKLGIEALKKIRYLQRMDADFKDLMLPSETED